VAGIAYLSAAVVSNALQPGPTEWLAGVRPARNPVVYLPAAKPLLDVIGVAGLCLLPGVGGAIAALVVRFRRSRGIERQQLKWFTYAAALAPLPFLLYEVVPGLFELLLAVTLPLVPMSVGIAILRYRLYEIDRIINRTLVYGLLTAVLGLGYAAGSLVSILVVGVGTGPPSWLVRGRDPGGGCGVSARPAPHPGGGGSAFQPASLQRGQDHPGVLGPPARADRPGHPLQGGAGGG
jgi:hypothetical protein